MGLFQHAEQYLGIALPIQSFCDPKIRDSSQKPSYNSDDTGNLALWYNFIVYLRVTEHCGEVIFSQQAID